MCASALIALAILSFVGLERWDARNPDATNGDADRVRHQCMKQNITELQVHECRIRLALLPQSPASF
jgi:hypothetical protein